MKARFLTVLLSLAAITWSCTNAQTPTESTTSTSTSETTADTDASEADGDDCEDEGEDCTCGEGEDVVIVNFSGEQPTILDFAHALLSIEDMGEGYYNFREAIEAYDKGKKPEFGELTIDKQNGYINYTIDWSKNDPGSDEASTNEICYWNCKDGRHKIIASNIKGKQGNRYYDTEVTGVNYLCYDSETKTMEWNSADQLGALILPEDLCWPPQDNENSNLGNDYFRYMPIHTLPRVGKNIKVEVADPSIPASKRRTCELIWNGNGFDKKFSK